MNYDPETYKVTVPYPDMSDVREGIRAKIASGEITVPPDRILDAREYVSELAKKALKPLRDKYTAAQREAEAAFRYDMEKEHGMDHLPEAVCSQIHALAYEQGHAYGYHEMAQQYPPLVELVRVAYENPIP